MQKLLEGKRGIIFGALNDQSIAWKVAEKCYEHGAIFTLSNTMASLRMGETDKLAKQCNTISIAADATNLNDLENVYKTSMEKLGGKIDFVLHSIGMSPNVRKGKAYDDTDYNYFIKTLDISALSFHKMLQVARHLDALNEWASVVALSYIAAQRTIHAYNDMAEAKALLESIARSFGYMYGRQKKVRVNTISQSPVMTKAGSGIKGIDNLLDFADRMSPLGNATADDCAGLCVALFSDLTRRVTMQNIFNDGGFSSMGMSSEVMERYNIGLKKEVY